MTGAEKDTLIALVEQGPLGDGDVPSKRGRDALRLRIKVLEKTLDQVGAAANQEQAHA